MSAYVLLNLLNELEKRGKMLDLSNIVLLFAIDSINPIVEGSLFHLIFKLL